MDRPFGKSSFNNVMSFFSSIPQSHEKAMKHAFYNAIALLLVFICGATAWGVFYVLRPFVKPLLWALLIGSVLHPFKHAIAKRFEYWIQDLEKSKTPVLFFFVMIPIKLVDDISETLGSTIVSHIKFLLAIALSTVTIFILYNYIPSFCVTLLTTICDISYQVLLFVMDNFSSTIFATVIIVYVIALSMYWSEESSHLFSISSYCVWFLISLYAARSFGILQIPLFLLLMFCLSFGFAFEVITVLNLTAENISCWATVQRTLLGKLYLESDCETKKEEDEIQESKAEKIDDEESAFDHNDVISFLSQRRKDSNEIKPSSNTDSEDILEDNSGYSREKERDKSVRDAQQELYSHEKTYLLSSSSASREKENAETEKKKGRNCDKQKMELSSKYLCGVFWACFIVMLWKYSWIAHLLPIPIMVYFIKNLGIYFGLWDMIYCQLKDIFEIVTNWVELREPAIFPAPVQGLRKVGAKLRINTMITIREFINPFASSLVIFGLIFFVFSFTTFIALQIYAEGIHLISVGAEIVNSTVVHNPEFRQLLPEGWSEKIDSALNNAYVYGREGISRQVQSLLKDVDKAKALDFEKHLLELWDRVYQAWLMGSLETSNMGPKVNTNAVFSSWGNIVDIINKTPDLFNLSIMTEFAKENVGTFVSLTESVWALLKGNINVIFQFLFATLSILLGGGTVVLNFVVSIIVFLTALFYLLSSSGELYKPVDVLSNFSPVSGNKLALAFEAAVNGVFKASFKMALFYGLWTWLIHNLFQVRIVYLPSVLAAILGAVPFLGTYWASIPAVLELWLAQHSGVQALLLLLFQCIPISFVDTAIYTEIKGGGHPYMTGLAIAGGVFCMGIEGAILGPVLLCCLLVVLNMSSTLMMESPSSGLPPLTIRQLRRVDNMKKLDML